MLTRPNGMRYQDERGLLKAYPANALVSLDEDSAKGDISAHALGQMAQAGFPRVYGESYRVFLKDSTQSSLVFLASKTLTSRSGWRRRRVWQNSKPECTNLCFLASCPRSLSLWLDGLPTHPPLRSSLPLGLRCFCRDS